MRIGRRSWLAGSAALGALAACGGAQTRITPGRAAPRVIVVGAGLAGLTVAHRLLARGIEPLVLEATERVGGRIRTVREPFPEGVYAEAGAMHVVPDDALVALADEVGAARVAPPRAPRGRRVLVRDGARSILAATEEPPPRDPLPPDEAVLGGVAAWARALGDDVVDGDPRTGAWIEARARLDGLPLSVAVAERHGSEALARMLARDVGMGEAPDALSALWVAGQCAAIRMEMGWAGGAGRFVGGTDRFPTAIAERLGDRVVRGAVVRGVIATDGGVRVRVERAGTLEELSAERVVVTVHAPVVREISFEPGLTAQAHMALEAIRTSSVVRAWCALDREVWQDEDVEGAAWSDGPFGDLRTLIDLGSPSVLSAYVSSHEARAITAMPAAERDRRWRDHVAAVHPAAREHVVATHVHAWDEDPWARGAYVWMPVGVTTGVLPAFQAPMGPSGRVHFAGDWTSHRPGFMHGAIASADRVVAEIAAAP